MVIWPFIHIRRVLFFFYLSLPIDFSLFPSRSAFSSPLFRSHLLRSVRVADFPSFSRSRTAMRSILASIFFLAGNTRTIKDAARQKNCPPPRKRHGNFNASAIPPLSLFRQRCCRSRYALFAPAVDGDIMVSLESSHVPRFRCRSRASLPPASAPRPSVLHLPQQFPSVSRTKSFITKLLAIGPRYVQLESSSLKS